MNCQARGEACLQPRAALSPAPAPPSLSPSPAPRHRLPGRSRVDRPSASHLDVRELAQVRVHGQQRLVHQLLVVIHPEQVIVLQEARAQQCAPGELAHSRPGSHLPGARGPARPRRFPAGRPLRASASSSVKWGHTSCLFTRRPRGSDKPGAGGAGEGGFLSQETQHREERCLRISSGNPSQHEGCQRRKWTLREGGGLAQEHTARGDQQGATGGQLRSEGPLGKGRGHRSHTHLSDLVRLLPARPVRLVHLLQALVQLLGGLMHGCGAEGPCCSQGHADP